MNPANAWLLLTARTSGMDCGSSGWGSLKPADVALALGGLDRPRFLLGMAALAGDRDHMHELVTLVKLEIILPMAEYAGWTIKRGSEAYRRMAALAVFELLNNGRCFVCNGKGTYDPPPEPPVNEQDVAKMAEERRRYRQAMRRLRRLEWRAIMVNQELKQGRDPKKVKRLKRILRWINQFAQMTEMLGEASACVTCRGSGELKLDGTHRAWLTGFSPDHWWRTWASRYTPLQYELAGWQSDCLSHVKRKLRLHDEAVAA